MDLLFTRKFGLRETLAKILLFWIVIQFPLCLPTIYAVQPIISDMGVQHGNLMLVLYGEPLEIFCSDNKSNPEDLSFRLGKNIVSSESFNSTTRRMYIHPAKGVYIYYCYSNKTKKHAIRRVLVDSPPVDVTDFKCKSMNLDELECTWTSSNQISVTKYILNLLDSKENWMDMSMLKIVKIGPSIYNFLMNMNTRPKYRQMESKFTFKLISNNPFGQHEQNFTIDHFSVVQPAPLTSLNVENIGEHSALLTWRIPVNMIDLLPGGIEHKIQYQIYKVDNDSYFRTVDATSLPLKNKTYKFQLEKLPYSHMKYEVRLFIRPVHPKGIWSDFRSIAFFTKGKSPANIRNSIYWDWATTIIEIILAKLAI